MIIENKIPIDVNMSVAMPICKIKEINACSSHGGLLNKSCISIIKRNIKIIMNPVNEGSVNRKKQQHNLSALHLIANFHLR